MELPSSSVDNLFVSSMRVTRMSWYLYVRSRTCCGTGILATKAQKKTIGRRDTSWWRINRDPQAPTMPVTHLRNSNAGKFLGGCCCFFIATERRFQGQLEGIDSSPQ